LRSKPPSALLLAPLSMPLLPLAQSLLRLLKLPQPRLKMRSKLPLLSLPQLQPSRLKWMRRPSQLEVLALVASALLHQQLLAAPLQSSTMLQFDHP